MSDAPFRPDDFPPDLVKAQHRLATLQAELQKVGKALPWSREPDDGWPKEPERWYRPGREGTVGWSADQAARYDQLWEDARQAAADVNTHEHWTRCAEAGADVVAARMALKHAEGAEPDAPEA
jgi:hypothetical protein